MYVSVSGKWYSLINMAQEEKRRSCWWMLLNSQNDSWRYVRLAHICCWSDGQGTAAVGSFLPAGLTTSTHRRGKLPLLYIQMGTHHVSLKRLDNWTTLSYSCWSVNNANIYRALNTYGYFPKYILTWWIQLILSVEIIMISLSEKVFFF